MTEKNRRELDPTYGEDEDTDATSLAARLPVLRWYFKTTRSLARSRPFFMPLGFAAICALAFYLGFPAMRELTELVLLLAHKAMVGLGHLLSALTDNRLGDVLDLSQRRAAAPVLAVIWSTAAAVKLALGAMPLDPDEMQLGYVVPGSGFLARCWGIVGKRIHQLKQATRYFLSYLLDLNIAKLYVPVCIPLLLVLAGVSLFDALENLLFELPARLEGMRTSTGFVSWVAAVASAVVILVLGIPMLVNSVVRAHQRSVRLREKAVKFVRRRLSGLFGLLLVGLPIVWMALAWLAGQF